jgi:hypothetical protein
MISTYFTRQGFISVELLPETEWFNYTFFTEIIFPNTVQSVSVFRRKMQARGYSMHIDNTTSHNSALSFKKTEELWFTRLVQPPYSPDVAPCHFFLFGYLKKELHGKNLRSQNEVISVVRAFWSRFHSNALPTLRRMDREITRAYCEWEGVYISKYPWFDMLSLLIREIESIAMTFAPSHPWSENSVWNWLVFGSTFISNLSCYRKSEYPPYHKKINSFLFILYIAWISYFYK